jgi:hypothetical protein
MAFVRVKGPDGSEFTIDEGAVETLGATVIDKEAVDASGRPLPHKLNVSKGGTKSASTSKES